MPMTVGNPESTHPRLARLLHYLNSDPDNPNLRAEVFDTALACGALEEAQFQLVHALRLQTQDPAWRHREALLALRQNRPQQAQALLEALLAKPHDAKADAAIRFNLAYAHFLQGAWNEAVAGVAALRAADDEQAALAWVLWLRCQHRLGHLLLALQEFTDATGTAARSAESWGVASLIAFDAEQAEQARSWSERALNQRPEQQEALVTSGSLALGEQDFARAQTLFAGSLRVNPVDGRSWSGMAFAYMLQRDFSRARTAFAKALVSMPEHIGTWIGLGWCEFSGKQAQASHHAFTQALRLDPNVAESHGGLAVALVQLGQTQAAEVKIEVALRLDPRCLSARYAQAMLDGETEDPVRFLRLGRRVLAQYPAPGASAGGKTLADVVLGPQVPE